MGLIQGCSILSGGSTGPGGREAPGEHQMMKFARRALLGAAVALVAAGTAVAQDGYNRWMVIHNNSGDTLMYLYATPTGEGNWSGDLLGQEVIGHGEALSVDFNDGTGVCWFDVQAQFASGGVMEVAEVNVCEESEIYF